MRNLQKSIVRLALLTGGIFLLGAWMPEAFAQAEQRSSSLYWTPPVATEGGLKTDMLLNVIFVLTLVVFVLTQAFFIYYLIRYRRRPGARAHYTHGNNFAELIWTATPTVIFLFLAIWGNRVWYELTSRPAPEDAVQVEIVSYQFGFDFRYAGEDGKLDEVDLAKLGGTENKFGLLREDFDLSDDFTSTELVVPVDRATHVILRSRDVIHSFYVPQFRLYQDMVPGRTVDWMWFVPTRTGNFQLACNQLCGTGHYNMKAPIRVVSAEEFETWVAERQKARAEEIEAIKAEKAKVAAAAQ